MKVGFTGTRTGLNSKQKSDIINFIKNNDIKEVHHGGCIGADKEFNDICISFGIKIIVHLGTSNNTTVINNTYNNITILQPKPYLDRNKDIVDSSDLLIACPFSNQEIIRSGTWSTVRYARKKNKNIIIF